MNSSGISDIEYQRVNKANSKNCRDFDSSYVLA